GGHLGEKQMNSVAKRKMIAASMIGNVIEWYDFAIYGNFAASIGRDFFPREDAVAQLISAFGVFARSNNTSLAALHMSPYGTDRRTGVCGTDRCYQASSRHQPACQARLPRLKMTRCGSRVGKNAVMHNTAFRRCGRV